VRAVAIVAYREQVGESEDGRQAFRCCDDLQKIRGIGPKTVENMQEYLEFE
jgi:DNA uptake protein ComE-like DNA-binding protein